MEAAGARPLEDEQHKAPDGLSLVGTDREAVLLQWERKIEKAEGGSSRFERRPADDAAPAKPRPAVAAEDSTSSRRFQRAAPVATAQPAIATAERRTITISGQPTPPRRRQTLAERHIAAQPDRIALWAFLLGLLLIAVAAGTAHA